MQHIQNMQNILNTKYIQNMQNIQNNSNLGIVKRIVKEHHVACPTFLWSLNWNYIQGVGAKHNCENHAG